MDVYIARQPIFNRSKEIYAYELLFRGGTENFFTGIDGDSATSQVLSNTFFNTGVEQLTSGKRAFINFTRSLLVKRIPLMFPNQFTTVEILEDVEPDSSVVEACAEFARQGFELALDDFVYSADLEQLISMARIIKVDFMKSSKFEIRDYCNKFLPRGIKLLAEKVETAAEFDDALALGFSYFQGYFFSKPQIIKETEIPTMKMNLLRIVSEARGDDFDVAKLQRLIEQDVGISYKLLRYLNSPFFRRSNEISSIRQAIVMLGEKGIRNFLSIIIMAELSQDKPDELIKSSVIRARMCEKFRGELGRGPDASELFTLGLFSHIDAILDNSMQNIMKKLPLSVNIKKTLLGETTAMKDFLDLAVNYQKGSWEKVGTLAGSLGLSQDKLPAIYIEALGWADSVFSGIQKN